MKKLIVLLLFVSLTLASYSQGLFKPVPQDLFTSGDHALKATGASSVFIPRISAGLIANQFSYNSTTKELDLSSFSKVGLGLSVAHFIPIDELPYNNYSINAFIFFPTQQPENGLSIALTISTLKYINIGAGYDFGVKRVFALTGVTYTF